MCSMTLLGWGNLRVHNGQLKVKGGFDLFVSVFLLAKGIVLLVSGLISSMGLGLSSEEVDVLIIFDSGGEGILVRLGRCVIFRESSGAASRLGFCSIV